MTVGVSAGPPAGPRDRRAARAGLQLLAEELPRVRAAALAWRNGIAALLAGLVGFGLIKGRTDVGELAPPYATAVGLLLLVALITGGIAAALLMRAAHGRPAMAARREVVDGSSDDPELLGRMTEAAASVKALGRGVALSFGCAALLVAAVGLTWYGPAKDGSRIEVRSGSASRCGDVVKVAAGTLTLKTAHGLVDIDLRAADGLAAVDSCPLPP